MTIEANREINRIEGIAIPLGVFAQGILYMMVSTYAMYFFTDVNTFAPAAVGTLFLIARIWDCINDPIFGTIADKTRTRWGKCKPYIMFAPAFVTIFLVMMFTIPDLSTTGKFIYASVAYVLFSMAYTVVDIPLWASPTVVTTDNKKVTSLISGLQIGAIVGAVLAAVVTMILVSKLGGESGGGFRNTAIVFGLFAFIVTSATGFIIKERVKPKEKESQSSFSTMVEVIIQNKYLIIALASSILINLLNTLKAITVVYYAEYNFNDGALVPIIMLAVCTPGLVGVAFTPLAINKFGKKRASVICLSASIVLTLAAYFAGYNDLLPVIILHGGIAFFTYVTVVIFTTMFADSVVYAEWKHGVRAEGTIFSFRTLNGKLASALAPFILGIILTSTGYIAKAKQTTAALEGLHGTITLIPAVILALCIIPVLFYDLTDERIAEMAEENQGTPN